MTDPDVKRTIVALLRESGPLGWYGIEIRLRVPRSAFRDGYTLMTYLDELVCAGAVVRTRVNGEERFMAAGDG